MLLKILRCFSVLDVTENWDDYLAITYNDFDEFCVEKLGILLSYEYGDLLNHADNLPSPSIPVTQDVDCEHGLDFTTVEEDVSSDEYQVKATSPSSVPPVAQDVIDKANGKVVA